MISLNDQPLTTRQFPHSSLLCADWFSTALSRYASMNRNISKVLTYRQRKKSIYLQGIMKKSFLFQFDKKKNRRGALYTAVFHFEPHILA